MSWLGLRGRIFLALVTVQVVLGVSVAKWVEGAQVAAIEARQLASVGTMLLLLGLGSAVLAQWLTAPLRRAAADADHPERDGSEALAEPTLPVAADRDAQAADTAHVQAALDAMPDGYVVLDADGDVVLANEQARRLLGDSVDDHPALASDGPMELAGARVEVTSIAMARGTLVRLQDVTELRRLESVRQDFVSNVSHELRTPVSVIRTNVEALQGGALEEPELARSFVDAIERNAERLGVLIVDLLRLADLDAGDRLALAPVDCGRVAWRVKESLSSVAAARQQTIRLEQVALGTQVLAEEGALEQVLTNLVENAIKYSPPGGDIHVRFVALGERGRIEVHDAGPGVPVEARHRVFERFYRVDKGRSRRMGGTGLGLSIVRHLAESMNGRAGVGDSDLGGARFWLELSRLQT
ncbi:MAG: PAS domain-containing protein [Proteobacteria bacterium]|nr:PAS domain-containing protein [Pseudomonadota bacterium]